MILHRHFSAVMSVVVLLVFSLVPINGMAQMWLSPPHAEQGRELDQSASSLNEDSQKRTKALSHYAYGVYLREKNPQDLDAYAPHFQQALRILPDSSPILQAFVAPFVGYENYNLLVDYIRPVAEEHPEVISLQQVLIDALIEQDEWEEASQYLAELIDEKGVSDAGLVHQLAVSRWEQGNYEQALETIRKRLQSPTFQDNPGIWLQAAFFHFARWKNLNQSDKESSAIPNKPSWYRKKAAEYAEKVVTKVREKDGTPSFSTKQLFELGRILKETDQWQTLLELSDVNLSNYDVTTKARLYLLVAEGLTENGKQDRALDTLSKIEEGRGDLPVRVRLHQAQLYERLGSIEKAIRIYRSQLPDVSDNKPLYLNVARLYLQNNEPKKAIEYAQNIPGDDPYKYYLISRAHYINGEYQKALDKVRKAYDVATSQGDGEGVDEGAPSLIDAHFFMYYGTLHHELENTEQAVEKARQARKRAPDDPRTANFLGYLLADVDRNLQEAEDLIAQAVEESPENAAYIDSQAWVYYRMEKTGKSLQRILKAIRLNKGDPDGTILYHAGDICIANDLPHLARLYFWRALQHDPEKEQEIKEKLEKLSSRL